MNPLLILSLCLLAIISIGQNEKQRLLILADMGNEPDEVQQMVHMIIYSNEFDIEGLIAVSGKYLHSAHRLPERTRLYPDLFHLIIDAYEKDLENLKKHADAWPEPDNLRSIVKSGQPDYGIAGMGQGKSTEGSEFIIECLEKNDPRPLYVVVNAGSNTLAQAITDYQANHSKAALDVVLKKLRVFENGAQDNAGACICNKYPNIYWVRSNYQTYCYGGPRVDGPLEKYQVVPYCLLLQSGRRVSEIAVQTNENDKGGKAIFIPAPSVENIQAALSEISADVRFEPRHGSPEFGKFSCIHKIRDGKHIYYFANSSDETVDTEVWLRGKMNLQHWDPHSGEITDSGDVSYVVENDETYTKCRLQLGAVQSVFWVDN